LKPGDQLLSINGIAPSRDIAWKLQYMFGALRPKPTMKIGVQSPDGKQRLLEPAAYIRETRQLTDLNDGAEIWNIIREMQSYDHFARTRYVEFGEPLMVMKLSEFAFTPGEVGEMMGKVRKHKALILDLRGNPGGSVETLEYIVGNLFGKDVKIA